VAQFGQYLLDRGVIDQQQLDEALQHHVLVGVRLGSCLAELGFVSINVIAKRLSEFHRAPLPPRDWLEKPDINAVKSVTRGLVERHRFVPLKLDKNDLHLAMLDPHNPEALDEIRFASGCRIVAYVLPEIVITHFLNRHFNVKPRTYTRKIKTKATVQERSSIAPAQRIPFRDRIVGIEDDRNYVSQTTSNRQEEKKIIAKIDIERVSHKNALDATKRRVPDHAIGATIDGLSDPLTPPSAQASDWQSRPITDRAGFSKESPQPVPFEQHPPLTEPTLPSINELKYEVNKPDLNDTVGATDATTFDSSIIADESADMSFKTDMEFAESDAPASEEATDAEPDIEPAIYDLARLEQQLLEADDREEVVDKVLAVASVYCQVAALFLVRQSTIQGLQGRGNALDSQPIDVILIPEQSESMLSRAVASAQSIRLVPEAEIDFRLLRALGRDQVCEAAIFPVVLKQRVVNLLYVDNGAYPIALSTFSALQTLVECASSAYTNLIKKRKEEKAA